MSFDVLRKIIMDTIESKRILLDLFYRQPIYVGDDCVEYECMELKHEDYVGKYFSSFHNLVAKVQLS